MHTSDSEVTQLGMGIRPIDSLGSSASTASNSTGSLSQGGSGGSLHNLEGVLGGIAGGGKETATKGALEEIARSHTELSKHGASSGWVAASIDLKADEEMEPEPAEEALRQPISSLV